MIIYNNKIICCCWVFFSPINIIYLFLFIAFSPDSRKKELQEALPYSLGFLQKTVPGIRTSPNPKNPRWERKEERKKKRGEIDPVPKSHHPKINGQEAHHVFSGKSVSPTDILTAHHFVCRVKPDLSLSGLPKNILPPQHWESRMLGKVVYVCRSRLEVLDF